ncbi:MAG: hypothetical protein ACRENO_08105 [Thermodesulfobacteriota bacterium]
MRTFLICNILLIVLLFSCAPRQRQKKIEEKPKPKISATVVVDQFLSALKRKDLQTAYERVHIISSDREGYINRLEAVYRDYDIQIVDYKLLATQLYKEAAIIVAEIEVDFKSPNTTERIKKTYRNRYDLSIFGSVWKITKDECIENCTDSF